MKRRRHGLSVSVEMVFAPLLRRRFACCAEVFRAEMGSGIAANPYLQFYALVEASGEFVFEWVDDAGEKGSERAMLTVID